MKKINIVLISITILILFYIFITQISLFIRKNIDIELRLKILNQLYNIVTEASKLSNTKPFLLHGTLLGYIRNNNIICYDFDVDIGILQNDYDKLYNSLKFLINNYYTNYIIINTQIFGYRQLKIIHKKTFLNLDMCEFKFKNDKIFKNLPGIICYLTDGSAHKVPIDYYLPLKPVIFKNQVIHIPNNSHKLLEINYGSNFLTPDHKCNNDCSKCFKI